MERDCFCGAPRDARALDHEDGFLIMGRNMRVELHTEDGLSLFASVQDAFWQEY
jgi:hypothetical protein